MPPSLRSLSCVSLIRSDVAGARETFAQLVEVARHSMAAGELTGATLFSGAFVVDWIEGTHEAVGSRHREMLAESWRDRMIVLSDKSIARRKFADWRWIPVDQGSRVVPFVTRLHAGSFDDGDLDRLLVLLQKYRETASS